MLRNCVCLVFAQMLDATPVMGWGGVGMMMFLELAHMLDATQLCLSCLCTHVGVYSVCLVFANWPKKPTTREDGDKTPSFFRRMVPVHWFVVTERKKKREGTTGRAAAIMLGKSICHERNEGGRQQLVRKHER